MVVSGRGVRQCNGVNGAAERGVGSSALRGLEKRWPAAAEHGKVHVTGRGVLHSGWHCAGGLQAPAGPAVCLRQRLSQQFGNLQDGLDICMRCSVPCSGPCPRQMPMLARSRGFWRLQGPAFQACEQVAQSPVRLWRQTIKLVLVWLGQTLLRDGHAIARDGLVMIAQCGSEIVLVGPPGYLLHRSVANEFRTGQTRQMCGCRTGRGPCVRKYVT